MYCLMMDGHIYTLNHRIKVLEQKQDEMDDNSVHISASADYFINEEAQAREANMIDTIEDILAIAKTTEAPNGDDEKNIVYLIHTKDD